MSHYYNGSGVNYFYSSSQVQYPTVNGSDSPYSPAYLPTQNGSSTFLYMRPTSGLAWEEESGAALPLTIPQQPQTMAYSLYQSSTLPTQRQAPSHPRLALGADHPMTDIESQDSINQDTMLSEPIIPPLDGYPDVKEFEELMKRYASCSFTRSN